MMNELVANVAGSFLQPIQNQNENPFAPIMNGVNWDDYWKKHHDLTNDDSYTCQACDFSLMGVRKFVSNSWLEEMAVDSATAFCYFFLPLAGYSNRSRHCKPIIRQFLDPGIVALADYVITKDRVCNEVMGFCHSPTIRQIPIEEAVEKILADKPDLIKNDDFLQNLYDEVASSDIKEKRSTIRAVHISDIHLDFEYKAGTIANCKEIMCCREDAGYPSKDGDIAAGEWGMPSRCDMPPKTY